MSGANAATASGIAAKLAPLRARWGALSPRDRSMALLGAGVLAAYALWAVGLQPALRTLRQAPVQIAALDAEMQAMQRLASEASELKAQPPLPADQAAAALKAASDRLGDRARLALQGECAVLTFNGLGGEALRGWLSEVRAGARARPVEAQFARDAQGFAGSVTVALGTGS